MFVNNIMKLLHYTLLHYMFYDICIKSPSIQSQSIFNDKYNIVFVKIELVDLSKRIRRNRLQD